VYLVTFKEVTPTTPLLISSSETPSNKKPFPEKIVQIHNYKFGDFFFQNLRECEKKRCFEKNIFRLQLFLFMNNIQDVFDEQFNYAKPLDYELDDKHLSNLKEGMVNEMIL
jgi:hypothetical protein